MPFYRRLWALAGRGPASSTLRLTTSLICPYLTAHPWVSVLLSRLYLALKTGAHLFVFYFAMLSMITPPVCIAAFVAAPMAGASPMKIGLAATRIGWLLYLVPFLFVVSPPLLLKGPVWAILVAAAASSLAVWGVGVALYGYARSRVAGLSRVTLSLASAALFALAMGIERLDGGLLLGLGVAGFVLAAGTLLWEYRLKERGLSAVRVASR